MDTPHWFNPTRGYRKRKVVGKTVVVSLPGHSAGEEEAEWDWRVKGVQNRRHLD
jgi:hypothetical protein